MDTGSHLSDDVISALSSWVGKLPAFLRFGTRSARIRFPSSTQEGKLRARGALDLCLFPQPQSGRD